MKVYLREFEFCIWLYPYKHKKMDAGIGISKYLDGTGKYKSFKGIKCKYAAKLFENNSIVVQKCEVNKF